MRRTQTPRRWLTLAAAVTVEVVATLALKAALTQPGWYAVVVVGYGSAFGLLAACLRLGMPVGVTYGLWGAAGVTATALLAAAIFAEPLTPVMAAGLALIVAGVLTVEIGSPRPAPTRGDLR